MTSIGPLSLDAIPRVAGVICRAETPAQLDAAACRDIDIAELRLDEWGEFESALPGAAAALRDRGIPILGTLRSTAEGGRCADDAGRAAILASLLDHLDAVDLELNSEAIGEMAPLLRKRGRLLVASYHDFAKTPGADELTSLAAKAKALGAGVFKVAARIQSEADHFTLIDFLRARHQLGMALCVIGMGELGVATRVYFPVIGSCLTYGFVDASSAPGQLSAARLTRDLREMMPAFRADHDRRKGPPSE